MSRATLDLAFREEIVARQERQCVSFRGFVAERVVVGNAVAYDYDWVGASQYLAIHDIIVCDGEISLDDARPEHVGDLRGRMTFAPQSCPISGWVSTVDRTNTFTSITFDSDVLDREIDGRRLPSLERALVHFSNPHLEGTLWKLDAALRKSGAPDALYLETLALTAIMELAQLADQLPAQPPGLGGLSKQNEQRLKDFVAHNLGANITLAEMAEISGLSRFHFARAFKTTFGSSPVEYVHRARVHAGMQLLATTQHTVSEVARQIGFSSADSFTAAFKKFTSQTPRDFRRAAG